MIKEIDISLKKENRMERLYVTDDLPLLHQLVSEGKKVAALLTEENCHKDFSGIPYALERIEELEDADYERIYRRLAKLPWDILETKRCLVREMTEADLEALYELYADKEITRFMEGLFENPEEERSYITNYRKFVYEFYEYGIWIVEEKNSGKIIGRAGVDPRDGENELGYVIGAAWQQQGYAYEVCRAIVDYIWQTQSDLETIVSKVHKDNTASIKLLQKLGFEKTGTEEEMDVYHIRKRGF